MPGYLLNCIALVDSSFKKMQQLSIPGDILLLVAFPSPLNILRQAAHWALFASAEMTHQAFPSLPTFPQTPHVFPQVPTFPRTPHIPINSAIIPTNSPHSYKLPKYSHKLPTFPQTPHIPSTPHISPTLVTSSPHSPTDPQRFSQLPTDPQYSLLTSH